LSEPKDPRPQSVHGESTGEPEKIPLTARLLLRRSLTARRAAAIIAGVTLVIAVAGGILERFLDHREFQTIGKGLWFALQTVTTVGYGDVTPARSSGRFIAAVIMLAGIGFLAVITASVTATLIEASRRRFAGAEADITQRLEEVGERLTRIETALDRLTPPKSPDEVGR
jgi:voltage-gated potassium channel